MTHVRVGTRGSDLALTQTRWICEQLHRAHHMAPGLPGSGSPRPLKGVGGPALCIEEVIIKTFGDAATDLAFDIHWPAGGFVGAIEQALLERRIDFAVHSCKDLPSRMTEGLTLAAVPPREATHDVLLLREAMLADSHGLEAHAPFRHFPPGWRIGTSSPRRAAQMRRAAPDCEIVLLRGNVPTRVRKLRDGEYDAIILAAAGLRRLGIKHEHTIDLPTNRFVPAAAQGALAVQARADDVETIALLAVLDDRPTRLAVEAERSLLSTINAGCHTPIGAFATVEGETITLRAQLFSDDGAAMVEGVERGADPAEVGRILGQRLARELRSRS